MKATPLSIASRYIGLRELAGGKDHPFIQWCFSLCKGYGLETPDEVPWCSAFMQHPPWELRLPQSYSAAARSWLGIGQPTDVQMALPGFDVAIFKRGAGEQPGPEVVAAPGHVGWFSHLEGDLVWIVSGNHGNAVTLAPFPRAHLLGIRRLLV